MISVISIDDDADDADDDDDDDDDIVPTRIGLSNFLGPGNGSPMDGSPMATNVDVVVVVVGGGGVIRFSKY